MEVGREEDGVWMGVPLGVDDGLSKPTRDFLDEERGVMLLLRKAFTGVTSPYAVELALALALGVVAFAPRSLRPGCDCEALAGCAVGAPASRGVRDVLAVRLLASFGFRVFWGVRSIGILLASCSSCCC